MVKFMKQCDEGKFGISMRRDPDILAARSSQGHNLSVG